MKRLIVHLENTEPLTLDADWIQQENGMIVCYVGLKPIAYFSPQKLVSIEVVGEFQPQTPEMPQPEGPPVVGAPPVPVPEVEPEEEELEE